MEASHNRIISEAAELDLVGLEILQMGQEQWIGRPGSP